MPEVEFLKKDGSKSKAINLKGSFFETEPNEHILHEYVKGFQQNQRQGSASTLNRARMQGGGRKPFRQKGTGRARAGSNISPLWTGGAVVWGPVPKDYYRKIPKNLKRSALRSAFSLKAREGSLRVVELPEIPEPKTKILADYLTKLGFYHQKTILLYEGRNDNLSLASKNIKYFNTKRADLVNPFDLLWHQNILITEKGLARIREVFDNG